MRSITAPSTKAVTAAGNAAATVPAVHWAGGRYPRGATHPQTLATHRPILPATLQNREEAAGGLPGTMACAGNPAREAPAMWTALRLSPTMGSITPQKPRQGCMKGTERRSSDILNVRKCTQPVPGMFVQFMLLILLIICPFRANMCTTKRKRRKTQ